MLGLNGYAIIGLSLAVIGASTGWYITSLKLETVMTQRDAWKTSYAKCQDEKELIEEVSREFESQKDIANSKLRDMRRLLNHTRVTLRDATSVRDEASSDREFRGQTVGEIGTGWLIDFAEDAEDVRLRLIGCQNYLNGLNN